jgi:hypothetical protein
MFSKKEIIIFIACVITFGLIIYFLPNIESKLTGRKLYEEEEVVSTKKEVDKYICTFGSNSNTLKSNIEATFYLTDNKVTRIYTRKTETYTKKSDYDNALISKEEESTDIDYTVKVAEDNINYTIITTKGINIKDDTKVDYPTTYEELTEYLEKNNYTCSIRYKN